VINMPGKRRLYTTGEIADMLGVTRQRALQIVFDSRRDFPTPFDVLPGQMSVWLREEVDAWIAANRPPRGEDPES
jgi:predicted DNA-binding transcriptional regulator AlpA